MNKAGTEVFTRRETEVEEPVGAELKSEAQV